MLKYVHFESVFDTLNTCQCIHWDKTQMLKKKYLRTKKVPFFFREYQLITVLLLICDSYMSWCTRFISLKLWGSIPIFDSTSFSISYFLFFIIYFFFIFIFYFLLFVFFVSVFLLLVNKMHGLFDFKTA